GRLPSIREGVWEGLWIDDNMNAIYFLKDVELGEINLKFPFLLFHDAKKNCGKSCNQTIRITT
ncbi:MAG: hypothetical protein ACTSVZ_10460, partial [Promethearchaeota archaeon]